MREQRAAMHPCEIWNLELIPSVSPLHVNACRPFLYIVPSIYCLSY